MPTPPDQNIPPLRKVKPQRVTLPTALLESVPKVCDLVGWIVSRSLGELTRAATAYRAMMSRAYSLGRGREQLKYWGDRWKVAFTGTTRLSRLSTALDFLGAGTTAIGAYDQSAKDSVGGRVYDGLAAGATDYAMGSTAKLIGGSPALAAADSVMEIGMKGAGLGSLISGTLQGAPVMATDPNRFHQQSLDGKYGTNYRLASAYGDFVAGDSKGLADFHQQSLKGELGVGFQAASYVGDKSSGVGAAGIRSGETLVDYARTGNLDGAAGLHDQMRRGEFGPTVQKMSMMGVYVAEQGYLDGFANTCERLFRR